MAKMITVSDSNYRRGMNSLDDPKALTDGECAELVNAFPGYPLKPRRGSNILALYNNIRAISKSFYATIKTSSGEIKEVVFFWAQSGGGQATLRYVGVGDDYSSSGSVAGNISGGEHFDFSQIDNIVYALAPSQSRAASLYAIEWKNERFEAREIPIGSGVDGFTGDLYFSAVSRNLLDNVMGSNLNQNNVFTASNNNMYKVVKPIDAGALFGGADNNYLFGYSWTFVRRTDIDAHVTSAVYSPGEIETIENPLWRSMAQNNGANVLPMIPGQIYFRWVDFGYYKFTHIRLYRTRNLFQAYNESSKTVSSEQFARGADRYFLADISFVQIVDIIDTVTAEEHLGEMNQLASFNYTMPPNKGVVNALYAKDRLFLGADNGSVYFSEIPGGDGGGDVGFAQEAKAKYALWFKPTGYRLDLDTEEGLPVTGLALLGDDLYLFKQNKVYVVAGGDPVAAPLRMISDNVGCPFPSAITPCVIFGEEALFFLSGNGPMLITSGGNIKPFLEFKIKELWPGTGNERISKDSCSASFWNNTLWVFFEINGNAKAFGYLSDGETNGAFEVRQQPLQGVVGKLARLIDGRALSVCNSTAGAVLVDFLNSEQHSDGGNPIEISLLSRKIYPGPRERGTSELFRLTGYCQFTGSTRPFAVEVRSNRRVALHNFYGGDAVFQSAYPASQEAVRRSVDFFPKADFIGEYFQYKITKGISGSGVFDFYSVEIECIPRPQLEVESLVGSGSIQNTW